MLNSLIKNTRVEKEKGFFSRYYITGMILYRLFATIYNLMKKSKLAYVKTVSTKKSYSIGGFGLTSIRENLDLTLLGYRSV